MAIVGNKNQKLNLIRNRILDFLDINMSDANEEVYERRSISISPKIHAFLQDFRGKLISQRDDVDYTTLVNYVLAYGIALVHRHPHVRTPEDEKFVNTLVGDRFRLTELSLGDEYENLYRLKQQIVSDDEESSAER